MARDDPPPRHGPRHRRRSWPRSTRPRRHARIDPAARRAPGRPPGHARRPTARGRTAVEVVVAGWRFELEVEDADLADLRERATAGREAAAHHGPTEVRAIIPGRVVSVAVDAGRRRRGRPAAPRGGGDEDGERAPRRRATGSSSGSRSPSARPSSSATRWSSSDDPRPTRPQRRPGKAPDPARDRWRETLRAKALKGAPERRDPFETSSGIDIRDLYTPADTAGLDEDRDLGRPGEYPFTRGVQPTMYRSRFWTMRQYAGFATAEETNQRFRYLLEQGQTGLSVAFDLPTQMGYDSDAPRGRGRGRPGRRADLEPGRHGGPARRPAARRGQHVDDDQRDGADPAGPLRRRGRGPGRRRGRRSAGTTQNDILKEYIARGTYIFPPRPSMRLVTDVFEFCATELPKWNTISISGYHMREAGATAAQELAFTLADAIAYVEAAVARGLDVDDFAGRLSLLLRRLVGAVRGGRQVPGRPPDVGDDHEGAVRGDGPALDGLPVPRPDRRARA